MSLNLKKKNQSTGRNNHVGDFEVVCLSFSVDGRSVAYQ